MTQPEVSTSKRPESVRVWLLGGFRVSVASRTIEEREWRLKKVAALVKLLALAPGNRLHREQVMETLWPDHNRRSASHNLRQALQGARRTLDPNPASGSRLIASSDNALLLCPEDGLWVDVKAFEETAREARRAQKPPAYQAALDLYAGELLPEDRYEEWVEGPRTRLKGTYLSLLIELSGIVEERGDLGSATELLGKVIAEEPTSEGAHASLMRVYALWGRRGEALSQYGRLKEILARYLDAEPSASVRALHQEIAAGRYPPHEAPWHNTVAGRSETTRHNLPVPMTTFVGREREIAEVKRELASARLLTLTGVGGSGKTRLGLEVVRDIAGAYPDGAWLAELAPLSQGELVAQEIANVLSVHEQPGRPPEDVLVEDLSRKKALLLLDNCEHLLEPCARLANLLLGSCPGLKILTTSREPLGVAGEVVWRVPPLAVPEDAPASVELRGYEGVRLLIDRARLSVPAFELTSQNAPAVAEICRRLEGMPLAIELAAGRMGALATEQIAERLRDSLRLLSAGPKPASPRQRTMRATIQWSHGLLSGEEKVLFERLSVFAGGFTLEAAEAVCTGGTIGEGEILDLLSNLVNKSLVLAEAGKEGRIRYRMLEPIRQYAREKLEEGGEADEVRGQHTAFFLDMAEQAEPQLDGPQQRLWVERLEREHDNLREALSWALGRGEVDLGFRFGGALWRFWFARGYLSEGIRWMERVLVGGEPTASRARVKLLEGIGWLAQYYDLEKSKVAYEEMLELSRELGEKGSVATALNSLGTVAAQQGDHERARTLLEENLVVLQGLEDEENAATTLKRYHVFNLLGALAMYQEGDHAGASELFEEGLALAREAGDAFRIGMSLTGVGYLALLQGDHERATALCQETLSLAHNLGSAGVELIPENLVNLGLAALTRGDHERATASFEEALAMSQDLGRKETIVNTLEGMASLAGARGEATRAARLWGAAEVSREAIGIVLAPGERALHEPYLATTRSRLGEAAWEEALTEGRAMSLEEAAEYALAEEIAPTSLPASQAPPAGDPTIELTPREEEVAGLVARGLTNRQISIRLAISERTAGNHVTRILRKLGLRSRAQVTRWAIERRLIAPDTD
jgi:predicted ATPase/DNA-binding SARP family transcriptional activator/DNA-binding CsgD family transcriptional regulator